MEKGGDAREAGDEIFAAGPHVEEDGAVKAFAGDGAGDDVAGCELSEGMDGEHKTLGARVEQESAFAAERLAEEEAGCAFAGIGGGVELVKLHVFERGTGTIGHSDAVSGRDGGIGGVAVDLAGSSAGEEYGCGGDGDEGTVFAQEGDADDAARIEDQVDRGGPLAKSDPWQAADVFQEGASDLATGGIAVSVEDAGETVRAFARALELALGVAVEGGAEVEQFVHAPGAGLDQQGGGGFADKAVAGGDGIGQVQPDVFVSTHGNGDAALGVGGVRFGERFLGDDEDGAGGTEAIGSTEARNAAAHHDEVKPLHVKILRRIGEVFFDGLNTQGLVRKSG